jgi:membrane associated rhomboid family serine protease
MERSQLRRRLFLFLSVGSVAGIFAGIFAAFSRKKPLAWITYVSASAMAVLSAILACDLLFDHSRRNPLSKELFIGSFHSPVIFLYGVAFICCSIEALIYLHKAQSIQPV